MRIYGRLFEMSPDGVIVDTPGGVVLRANAEACRILGYSETELVALGRRVIVDDPAARAFLATGPKEGFARGLLTLRRSDGSTVPVDVTAWDLRVPSGEAFIYVVFRDVSERQRAERAAAERRGELESILATSMDSVWFLGPDGGILEVNEAGCAMLGYRRDEMVGKTIGDIEVLESPEETRVRIERLMLGGRDRFETRQRRKDGRVIDVEVSVQILPGTDGKMVAFSRDITDSKRAEEALQQQRAELEAIRRAALDGYWLIDGSARLIGVNDAACSMLGYTREEMLSMRVLDVVTDEDDEVVKARMKGIMRRAGDRFQARHRRKDGRILDVEVSVYPVAEDGSRYACFIRDVTAVRAAEAALRASEARFRTLADSSPVGVFANDASGVNIYLNKVVASMLGMTQEAGQGKGWHEAIHPDDRERVIRTWYEAVTARKVFLDEHRFLKPTGEVVVARVAADAIRNDSGEVTGYVGVVIDVTKERLVEQQLAVASRLAALGTLVAGVGHEINNPLAAAMANDGAAVADLAELQERLGRGETPDQESLTALVAEIRESVEGALEGDKRVARIVKDLVALGRSGGARERVRLRDVVDAAIRWLPPTMGREAMVEVVDAAPPDILGKAGQLSQVVLNLISNAVKAARKEGQSKITVRMGPGKPGMARLEVDDDGVGMTPELMKRIFDPFYSTREVGQGTGLGLSICHAIVTEHGGTINVKSEPGKGSTFTVELPAA